MKVKETFWLTCSHSQGETGDLVHKGTDIYTALLHLRIWNVHLIHDANLMLQSGAFKVLSRMRLQLLEVDASQRKRGGFFTCQRWEGNLIHSDQTGRSRPRISPRSHLRSMLGQGVPRMCAWFHSHGNNSKAVKFAGSTEGKGLPSYLK